MQNRLLELKGLTKHFGGVAAVQELDLEVIKGEILGLIGPNGAGKTTMFNLVSGVLKPTRGRVILEEEDITRLKPNQVARRGLVRTFQASTVFPYFTVIENVLLGCHLHAGIGFFGDLFNIPSTRRKRDQTFEKTMDIVNFTGLASHKDKLAENLSSGYQKILAIAIALATDPRLLLLDEPATTLSPYMVNRVMELITKVRDAGTTVVIIEHNMKAIMDYCDRIVVLANGKKIAEGLPHEIKENREVIEAYLGVMV